MSPQLDKIVPVPTKLGMKKLQNMGLDINTATVEELHHWLQWKLSVALASYLDSLASGTMFTGEEAMAAVLATNRMATIK